MFREKAPKEYLEQLLRDSIKQVIEEERGTQLMYNQVENKSIVGHVGVISSLVRNRRQKKELPVKAGESA